MHVVVLIMLLIVVPLAATAQPLAPPHMVDMSDFSIIRAIAGFFVGLIPATICLKIGEAIGRRWQNSFATGAAIFFALGGLVSLGATIYFWVWVM